MDKLPSFGRTIGQVVLPTYGVYAPLIAQNASKIQQTKRETFKYGPHPRQELDVYQSSSITTTKKDTPKSLLVFMHGGGFANGDKVNEAQPLFYKNLGHFFADGAGIETICLNYRLIKHGGKFPTGAEDIEAALKWIVDNHQDQQCDVYLFGNSAGGINVAHWMFEPAFCDFRRSIVAGSRGVKLSGVIILGALFSFNASSAPLRQALAGYLQEDVDDRSPVASLNRCEESGEFSTGVWPRLLLSSCEWDPDDVIKTTEQFVQILQAKQGVEVDYLKIKGHNHISPPLALGSEIEAEEAWGHEVVAWIKR